MRRWNLLVWPRDANLSWYLMGLDHDGQQAWYCEDKWLHQEFK